MDPPQLPARATASLLPLLLVLQLLLSRPSPCCCDPDPLQDFCVGVLQASGNRGGQAPVNGFPCKAASDVVADDFFFSGLGREGNTSNRLGSAVTMGNVLSFPGLNTLELSMNRVDFAPGGVNPPHVHPRAAELVLVAEGSLLMGFVSTGNVFFSKVVKSGEIFVVPRGLVHFQYNVGEGKAVAFTAFDSQLPGTVVVPVALFGSTPSIPNDVLAKAFQVDDQIVRSIKAKFGS